MQQIRTVLKKYELRPYSFRKEGKATIIETRNNKYVFKKKTNQDINKIYKYLDARNFDYYPNIINELDEGYELTEYLEDTELPKEQKIFDMIDLVGLLHNKTTYYKEVDESDYKELYEDITNNIIHLNGYYHDLLTILETHVYMAPSEYLLARNITKIFSALKYCEIEIKNWYESIKDNQKKRVVVVHNNLEPNHFIRNEKPYLISWDKSKIDIPIFDLYKLYKKTIMNYDFVEILNRYEYSYGLLEEERTLFLILVSLPEKIILNDSEYNNCIKVSNEIDRLYKTEKLVDSFKVIKDIN